MRILLLAALLLLAACTGDATAPRPAELAGTWVRSEVQAAGAAELRTNERVELGADGHFTWVTEVYGPEGRPEDGLMETFTHGGDWELRGDRLALRTVYGMGWRVGTGGYQDDYVLQWNLRQQVRLRDERLHVTYVPEPQDSFARRTVVFSRGITLLHAGR